MTLSDSLGGRDRIVTPAYELSARHGVHAVGAHEVVDKASVAKTTLYRHFRSKEDFVSAFLDRRGGLWTVVGIDSGPRYRPEDPERQLLEVFQLADDWFHRHSDYHVLDHQPLAAGRSAPSDCSRKALHPK